MYTVLGRQFNLIRMSKGRQADHYQIKVRLVEHFLRVCKNETATARVFF